jgi:hypothetical protein
VQTIKDRDTGFKRGLAASCPGVKVGAQRFNDNDINTAASQVNDVLTANPSLVGVFTDNNTSGTGAARAIKDNKASDKIPVVAFDTDPRRTRRSPTARSTRSSSRTRTSSATRASCRPAWPSARCRRRSSTRGRRRDDEERGRSGDQAAAAPADGDGQLTMPTILQERPADPAGLQAGGGRAEGRHEGLRAQQGADRRRPRAPRR